ncbi:MAG: hypothetical protein HYS27_23545 [Deltaproteobacteria bacterium]|nr:hypothetical protein [Deltaproteobacteria bacterium]
MRIARLDARPLSIPLREPFVISSGRVDSTRGALVVARIVDERSSTVHRGLGEAAALPAVTGVDQPDLLRAIARANGVLAGQSVEGHSDLRALLDDAFDDPVSRAGAEAALLDAWGKKERLPAHALLGSVKNGAGAFHVTTDVTLPIAEPAHVGELASGWQGAGFTAFKVKVGRDLDDDARTLEQLARRCPKAEVRLDANGALAARDAMTLISIVRGLHLTLGCFEQPCAADDLEGMAHVTLLAGAPVVADESVKTIDDLFTVAHKKAATAVNLKLMKHGGPVEAGRIGRAAQRLGMKIMVGAMVETRLGLAASLHLARSLGKVDLVDLDTSLLLRWDPFEGGYAQRGAELTLLEGDGIGVGEAAAA